MSEKTARQLIEDMPKSFRPERAGRANVVVQFKISGKNGGDFVATIKNRTCTVVEGTTDSADATIRMTDQDYLALASGRLNGMKAFATGRVKASGDISLLQRMDRWFVRI